MVVEPVVERAAVEDFLGTKVTPTLVKGLTALCKTKPADPVVWLADWLHDHNPNAPKVL